MSDDRHEEVGPYLGHDDGRDITSADDDRLEALRVELDEQLDQLPVADRLARFEHANDVLAEELAALDEV